MDIEKLTINDDIIQQFYMIIKCWQHAFQQQLTKVIISYINDYGNRILHTYENTTRLPLIIFTCHLFNAEESYALLKLLINYGLNVHGISIIGQNALFHSCKLGKIKCIQMLLELGLDVNSTDIYGVTPIFLAAKYNRLNVVQLLLKCQVKVNVIERQKGQNPLFYAAAQGNLQMCRILIQAGCNIKHKDYNGKTALFYSKMDDKSPTYQYLKAVQKAIDKQKQRQLNSKQSSSLQSLKTAKLYRIYKSDLLGNVKQLTKQEWHFLLQKQQRLHELCNNKNNLNSQLNLQLLKTKSNWQKIALDILSICMKQKGAVYFQYPVDVKLFNLLDYHDIIKQPMDFGTIKNKIWFNVYDGIYQFIEDMNLVFNNCYKYNGKQHSISLQAMHIERIFCQNLKIYGYIL